jgi:phage baseplate assembly protein W
MAINLDFLDENKVKDKTTTFSYSDLSLDFELSSDINNTPVNRTDSKKDVKLLYDEDAIYQSVKNVFNTIPGQKILNPEFGLDLRLPLYEPRVIVNEVNIVGRPSQNEYFIELSITIPTLNNKDQIVKGVLDTQGFRYE